MPELKKLLTSLRKDGELLKNIIHWERIEAREGSFVDFPTDIHPLITEALKKRGISRLYEHQEMCFRYVLEGKNVVVVTPTASGKTLCYNLPVLNKLLNDREARALYVFPTKALSQDQQAELNDIVLGGGLPVKINTYDGDTPSSVRISARESGRIIVTNPDMLHTGILPNHPKWIKFIGSLAFVVIDEIHIYRGVFGSHMANLIRRLRRITRFYGCEPIFICCSATIGNPRELAERIIGGKAVLIDKNGAPSGEKHIILYNPPLVDRVQGIRRGVVLESSRIASKLLREGVKTIVFARSRIRTEIIASYIRKNLKKSSIDNGKLKIESYRGGYLPTERRAIERGLREGTVRGVVSTNALELGIDIGGLDVAILAGLPGSIASSWQQAGRAGRRNNLSLAILIASAAPTDQYMINHPEYFFSRSPESGWVDPDNIYILIDHIKCAVFELPFKKGEKFGGNVEDLLEYLEENGVIRYTEGSWYWADRSYPAEQVSLRSASSENVVIIDTTKGENQVIGEMDRPSAKELLFEGAIYIHRGDQYLVKELDIENKQCLVEENRGDYFTDAIVKTDIKVLEKDRELEEHGVGIVIGDVLVRTQVTKYKKIRYRTHENTGYGDVYLPEEEMHTRSVVLLFGENTPAGKILEQYSEGLKELVISRIGNLMINVAPVFLLCDVRDIRAAERVKDPHFSVPALYIYDACPGGSGLSEGFYENLEKILTACMDVVKNCGCERGCPSCIGAEDRKPGINIPAAEDNPKEVVMAFVSTWIKYGREKAAFQST